MTKAVALLSGGLDSMLAVRLVMEQGIEVHALNFTSVFCTCNSGAEKLGPSGCKSIAGFMAEKFGITIKVMTKGLDYIDVVRAPKYGYGKGMNPCVDCRIYIFNAAKRYMEEIGASFIVTGEVLGQRPMSQRRDNFKTIERDSGLEGLILRPLCAKNLEPSLPERQGLVDRDKLLDMAGRSRKPQIELASDLGEVDYPCPSGGCLLTDKIFSKKVRDLLLHKKEVNAKDLQTLKAGRHFRFEGTKVIVGRDEADNARLRNLLQPGDTLVEPVDFPGPIALVLGEPLNGTAAFAGGLIVRYSLNKAGGKGRVVATRDGVATEFIVSEPAADALIMESRLC